MELSIDETNKINMKPREYTYGPDENSWPLDDIYKDCTICVWEYDTDDGDLVLEATAADLLDWNELPSKFYRGISDDDVIEQYKKEVDKYREFRDTQSLV